MPNRPDNYRRKLPHWRPDGALYFVTWRLARVRPVLSAEERDVVQSALLHFDGTRYDLHRYVVMDDHVHVLVRPSAAEPLQRVVHTWKSFTARRLQVLGTRRGAVWQDEYYDRFVRCEQDLEQIDEYIRHNPCKRWPGIREYRWLG